MAVYEPMISSRRSFITGLVALVAAPTIVRASSLMPVKNIDVYDTRCLWDYDISRDVMILRVDRQLETMLRPAKFGCLYVCEVPVDVAKRVFGNRATVFNDCPPAGKRVSSFIEIGANRLCEFGFKFPNSGDNALGLVPATT
jgi:hypothetical protein